MPTSPSAHFDAIKWIGSRQPALQRYIGQGSQPLLHFALMWNMFEGELCESSASVGKLKAVADTLSRRDLMSHAAVTAFLGFVKNRYWSGNTVTERFQHLRFRSPTEVEAVTAMLSGKAGEDADVLYALFLVIYRYRNNTFHGLKEVAEVLGSQDLFDQSARFLGAILEHA